jgi:hypothetical protein
LVVHIGLNENNQCEDQNNNGIIDASTGLGGVKTWSTANVATAEDECIIHYVKVNSRGTRHVSVNSNNDVWVSGSIYKDFDLIKGGGPAVPGAGIIIRSEPSVAYGGYGGVISGDVLWSARPLLRWDTKPPVSGANGDPLGPNVGPIPNDTNWAGQTEFDSYGLCIDRDGNFWNTALTNDYVVKYDKQGIFIGKYPHGYYYAQGCLVDTRDERTNDV